MGAYIVAFESTHAAMAADAALASAPHALIPTPRAIAAGCGMALRFEAEDDARARRAVEAARIPPDLYGLYREERHGGASGAKGYRAVP